MPTSRTPLPASPQDGASPERLRILLEEVRACQACADLPLGAKPVLQASATARLLIAGQAPGTRAHDSGIPFSDASGEQLRRWMGIAEADFQDPARVAIIPMGLCYPGRAASGGDAPPRRECAPLWREALLEQLPRIEMTLLVGTYAQDHVLGSGRMTDRVRAFRDYLPEYFPLPHPSWRSRGWMTKNPWFEQEVLPELRRRVQQLAQVRDGSLV
ncbi:uracil-DNA glycosylase family protein [Altererythrobacter xixiisoli]|uniref:Uracil-DNA glycosylase family protein n=1 Tax=Croceibacterium xixiisoli TaxID=1476466 RepID=A0A6I4TP73_9SPHN|nr:uracil-DNA glycosylase family protein [Croceibacterium xixiisoli]MXO97734.1 uracil-DNA glycosylase family protein [Croceibacterium xixiisoli]